MNGVGILFVSDGSATLVDASDLTILSGINWHRSWDGYVFGSFFIDGKQTSKGLGAFILNTAKGVQCDHINGDKNDNRRSNLRAVTLKQNQQNQGKRLPSVATSKFKGVYWCKGHNAWRSQIRVDGKKIHLGTSRSQEDAALKYNIAASKHFGQFARLNIVKQEPLAVAGEQKGQSLGVAT